MKRDYIGFIISGIITLVGLLLRFNSYAIAYPETYSFSGPRSETPWAQREVAIIQVALILVGIGGLLFVVTFWHWLFAADENGAKR